MASTESPAFSVRAIARRESIPAFSFAELMGGTIQALIEVDRTVSGVATGSLDWRIVSMTMASPATVDLTAIPKVMGDFSHIVTRTFCDGVEHLDNSASVPANFSQEAVKQANRFLSVLRDGLPVVEFRDIHASRLISPSIRAAENAFRLANPSEPHDAHERGDYYEHGEIEGTLQNLLGRTGKFHLWESLTGHRIICTLPESLQELARKSWMNRVIVSGRIKYSSEGTPRSMSVESISEKPNPAGLPLFKDFGIDITGGVESSEYIRNLRDAY